VRAPKGSIQCSTGRNSCKENVFYCWYLDFVSPELFSGHYFEFRDFLLVVTMTVRKQLGRASGCVHHSGHTGIPSTSLRRLLRTLKIIVQTRKL
jgi:hypothetical protein